MATRRLWPHVLAVTVAATLAGFVAGRDAPDTERYLAEARNLAASGMLSLDGQTPTLRDVPGFPLFLAACLRLGLRTPQRACWLLNGLCVGAIAAGCAWALARLTRHLSPPPAPGWRVLTVYAVAFLPSILGSALFPLTELPYTALWLGSNLLLLGAWQGQEQGRGAWGAWGGAGALLAAACYVRPVGLLFPVAAAAAGLWTVRRQPWRARLRMLAGLCLYGATAALLILPWSWRNLRTSGHLVPLATGAGMHLYIGASQEWRGDYPDFEPVAPLLEQGWSLPAADRELGRQAVAAVCARPAAWLALVPVKLGRLWLDVPGSKRQIRSPAVLGGLYVFQVAAVAGAVLGLRGQRRHPHLPWLLAPLLYVSVLHSVLFAMARFRVPAEPYMVLALVLALREGALSSARALRPPEDG